MSEQSSSSDIEASLEPVASEVEALEECSCGHDRNHHMVSELPTYTTWGAFWISLLGVSATPIRMDFKCRVCGEIFDFIREAKQLKKYL